MDLTSLHKLRTET